MANPIRQVIAAVGSLISGLILSVLMEPIVGNNLYSEFLDSVASPTGMLVTNSAALTSAALLTVTALRYLPYFVCGVVLFNVFFYISFKTEEVNYG